MAAGSGGSESLADTLTQRERNILAHLTNNRSSKEIAELETLAPTSVKWYIHQIYAKLGVSSRGEALLRARALALLGHKTGPSASALPRNNLPRQFTSFIGREQEILHLQDLICSSPLVTLTGSGGTGKTRLALQAAEAALADFPDGAWFIDLAPLSDPALVPLVAATALGIHGVARESALRTLLETIGPKRLLLVLDNCEHLIAAAAELAHALLTSCPRLHILATSRELLGLGGERALRCPPLALPPPHARVSFAELTQFEALRLFSERAADTAPHFQLSEANAALIQQICLRLDGIPLAIELAAARLRLLSIQQIAERLENIFYLLTGGGRSALPRHKTLKAMVDWSYDLLSEAEQCLLNRLSVFSGGWTLTAAEAICAGTGLPQAQILDLLAQLVDKSLVDVQAGRDGEPRYRLLEMIRQYAHHRLLETGGLEELRQRHLDAFCALALRAEPEMRSPTSRQWRERFADDFPDIRLALEWALAASPLQGLQLAAGLYWFWFGSKYRGEGLDSLERQLAADAAVPAQLAEQDPAAPGHIQHQLARGKALTALAYMAILDNRDACLRAAAALDILQPLAQLYPREAAYAHFVKLCADSSNDQETLLELARQIDYPWLVAEILEQRSFQACWRGELDQALTAAREAFSLYTSIGDANGAAGALWQQGTLAFLRGDHQETARLYQAAQDSYIQAGDEEMFIFSQRFPTWLALARGDYSAAAERSRQQVQESQAINIPWVMADALGLAAWAALSAGDLQQAHSLCQQTFALSGQVGQNLMAQARYVMARLALVRGDLAEARLRLEEFVRHNYHNFPPVQLGLQLFATLALAQPDAGPQQARRAALLLGAQDSLSACLLNVIPPPERAACHAALAQVQALLSPQDFAAAWSAGQALSTPQAIAYALDELPPALQPCPPPSRV